MFYLKSYTNVSKKFVLQQRVSRLRGVLFKYGEKCKEEYN